ncbi:MAG: hypothetical protein WC546_02650 [Candidatus Omnitrophota bacterium]|nr:hypothetical protein [Candidatus Omnitrophota bacterium]
MKCLSRKQLLLFFYNELNAQERDSVKKHFLTCSHCSKNYENLNNFLESIKKEKVDISQDSLNSILRQVEIQTKQESFLVRLWQRVVFTLEELMANLEHKPQLAAVAFVIIAAFLLLPVINNREQAVTAKVDIVDIEMELAFEDQNNTDVILDIFNLDSSQKSSSTFISS